MACYVDNVSIPYGRMRMNHLWADSLPELLAMADRIGVARKWLQKPPKASWVHFDISVGKRALAIAYGAVLTDKYGPAEHEARGKLASDKPERVAAGQAMLDMIANARVRDRLDKLEQGKLL